MTRTAALKKETLKSTLQQLGSIVKSSREIMRKDKGLNGDIDRLPMLTWIMFLKFLDDMEQVREAGAKLVRQTLSSQHRVALPPAGLGSARLPELGTNATPGGAMGPKSARPTSLPRSSL
jgi:hypothetical protein